MWRGQKGFEAYHEATCGNHVGGKFEINSSVDRKERRDALSCPLCPPHRVENAGRRPKHGEKKPRYKNRKG